MANITIANLTGNKTLASFGTIINTATDNVFFNVLLFSIFIIVLINTLRFGFDKSIIASCFIMLIPSIFLYNIGWVSIIFPVIFGIGLAGGLMYSYFNNT